MNKNFFINKGLSGIQNLGNTCFINAVIQCINANYDLNLMFINNNFKLNKNSICHHFIEQWIDLSKELLTNSIVNPIKFLKVLNIILAKKQSNIILGNQEDSQEIIQYILEIFHEGLSKKVSISINGIAKNETDLKAIEAFKTLKIFFENEFSSILNLYYGQYYTLITNNKTDEKTENYEPFSNLLLEIPDNNNNVSIYDCIDKFTENESIIDGEKIINKKILFWNLPLHLIITFKRTQYSNFKNNQLITFPEFNLDLQRYCIGYQNHKCIYDLYGTINHNGNSQGGHYYSCVKNLNGKWYQYNDEVVNNLSNDICNENVYCLFYKKKI